MNFMVTLLRHKYFSQWCGECPLMASDGGICNDGFHEIPASEWGAAWNINPAGGGIGAENRPL